MNENTKHIFLVVDDNDGRPYQSLFEPYFKNAHIETRKNSYEAISFLNNCKSNDQFPSALILDVCNFNNEQINSNFGYSSADAIFSWYFQNDIVDKFPKNILLRSADIAEAEATAIKIKKLIDKNYTKSNININVVDTVEITLANTFLNKRSNLADIPTIKHLRTVKTSGYRQFLNNTLGLDLPLLSVDELIKIEKEKKNSEKQVPPTPAPDQIPHTFFVIDDSLYENPVKRFVTPFFPDAETYNPSDGSDAVEQLLQNNIFPDCLIVDACAVNKTIDTAWGFENVKTILNWYENNAIGKEPKHIIIKSNDGHHAKNIAEHIKETLGYKGNVYAADIDEPNVSLDLVEKTPVDINNRGLITTGHREFLNNTLNLNLPLTIKDIFEYQIADDKVDNNSISKYVSEGIISLEKGIRLLSEPIKKIALNDFQSEVIIGARQSAENGSSFIEQSGDAVTGYAAFSKKDILELAKENKKSILFVHKYNSNFVPYMNDIAGIVFTTNKTTGHIKMIMEGFNVSSVIGVANIHEQFVLHGIKSPQFLYDLDGKALNTVSKIEKKDGKKSFISYEPVLYQIGVEHIKSNNYRYSEDEALPPIRVDISSLTYKEIKFGDEVTLDSEPRLFKGHYEIKKAKIDFEKSNLLSEFNTLVEQWHKENGFPLLKFKANIDSLQRDFTPTNGVGLVRTEHLLLTSENRKNAFCDYIINKSAESFNEFVNEHTSTIYEAINNINYYGIRPMRIRLLDAPPSEFFTEKEIEKIGELYGDKNIRGVQFGMAFPEVYEAQIRAIFTMSQKVEEIISTQRGDDNILCSEILVPTVRTEEELVFVKNMVERIADEIGIDKSHYSFGSMIETKDAVQNIKKLIPHCDFINIGTNDLTSEILDCARDDWDKISKFNNVDGLRSDPFKDLYPEVRKTIISITKCAKSIKSDIDICVCGEHVKSFESLYNFVCYDITSVSMTPSEKYMLGLKALYYNSAFDSHYYQLSNPIKPQP